MLNNNHKSELTCAFGETLVSVLYGEATQREIKTFDQHLDKCSACSEELATFGTLRSAVFDWRETDFAPLALPNIVLPRENETTVSVVAETASRTKSWREFFLVSNFGWRTAGVSFAGLLILGFLLVNSTDFIKPTVEVVETLPIPSFTATPEIKLSSKPVSAPVEKTVAQDEQAQNAPKQSEEKTNVVSVRATNKMPKQLETSAASNRDLPKRRISNRKANQTTDDLSISPVEAEDKTPRLTDLLEEIEPSA
jgi:hypothetical protein